MSMEHRKTRSEVFFLNFKFNFIKKKSVDVSLLKEAAKTFFLVARPPLSGRTTKKSTFFGFSYQETRII